MVPMLIIAAHLAVLFAAAVLVGFIRFGEEAYGSADTPQAPIALFRIDNTYNVHLKGIGGFAFLTWFAIVFVGSDGDTVTRLYGWENPHPRLDP